MLRLWGFILFILGGIAMIFFPAVGDPKVAAIATIVGVFMMIVGLIRHGLKNQNRYPRY